MCLVEVDTGRGPAAAAGVHDPGRPRAWRSTPSRRSPRRPRTACSSSCSSTTRSTARCATRAASARCRTRRSPSAPARAAFVEEKRHFEKPIPLSALVYLDRERCILCDRCTRFADEVAGDPLISFIDRGDDTEVNTFPDHPFASYFSGNTVQICPVGALTADAVPVQGPAVGPRPGRVHVHVVRGGLPDGRAVVGATSCVRYLGVDVDPVNQGWLCDKGRFDFEAVNSDDRLTAPLRAPGRRARRGTVGRGAVEAAARGACRRRPDRVAVLGGARLPNEDAYAWAKLAKDVIGTDNVDCQLGDGLPAEVVLGLPRATIDDACAADDRRPARADLKEELPVLFLRLRDAVARATASAHRAQPHRDRPDPYAAASLRYRPGEAAAWSRALTAAGDGGRRRATATTPARAARQRPGRRASSAGPRWPSPARRRRRRRRRAARGRARA